MNPENLEHRMQDLRPRKIPENWRSEILAAARAAVPQPATRHTQALPQWRSLLARFQSNSSAILWPSPTAWAGLAALWLIILVLNFAVHDTQTAVSKPASSSSTQILLALKQQERLLAELIESPEASAPPDRPIAPKPHSQIAPKALHA